MWEPANAGSDHGIPVADFNGRSGVSMPRNLPYFISSTHLPTIVRSSIMRMPSI